MKLMMLGETTGNKRSKEEYDFLGTNASSFIWQELAKYNLYRKDFYTYSVFGDLGHKKKELSEKEYSQVQIELRRQIMMVEPDLVLSVGRHPTEEIIQNKLGGEFYNIVGELLYSTEYEIWFVPTIHPTVCARSKEKLSVLESNIANFFEYLSELVNEKP